MLSRSTDPIIAVATAPGRGAVGIVRVSGRGLAPLVEALLKRTLRPREATYLPFPDIDGQPIDQGLALFFPAPHSFTGEDVLELQAHGGDIVLQLLVARCLEVAATRYESTGPPVLPHLRVAEPGEFSARAFHNGKLDLAQSEAVADLIDASTEASARSATRSLSGAFSRDIGQLREGLIRLRMLVEATLDFPEEDIDFLERDDAAGQLAALQDQLALVRGRARQGALLREGIRVVIAGQPNAGKSSLLNALAGAELAIVSPVAGTTRDVVSQSIQIEGVPLHVVDTAGLRQSTDEVERIGIERAWQQIRDADVVLHVHDLTLADNTEVRAATQVIRNELRAAGVSGLPVIDLWNKCDLGAARLQDGVDDGLRISARSGAGLQDLRQKLLTLAGWQPATEGIYLARARHLDALAQVDTHLCVATRLLSAPTPALDLLAEELRLTQSALNQITGEFVADDLLGEIFSRFCIGK